LNLDPPGDGHRPTVSIVTVNYNGRRYLERFLDSTLAIDYPPQCLCTVLVDNASTDGSVEFVRDRFPHVRVLEAGGNLGFAGGCNLGIRHTDSQYVALVNNDTVVERGWLRLLVETAESDPRIGLVGSKLLFLTPFLDLRLETLGDEAAGRPGATVLLLRGARAVGCEYDKLMFRAGRLASAETDGQLVHALASSSRLAVPLNRADAPATLVLDLAAAPPREGVTVGIRLGDTEVARLSVPAIPQTFRLEVTRNTVARAAHDVINNAGTRIDGEGQFGDRGIFEFDEGQFDSPEDVPALCGASVLLRRRMLERIGGFDLRYFMYFEDVDLSWRARRAGWRVVYAPGSRLRHVHSGTSHEGSPLWTFFVTRNRLFFLIKHGTVRGASREVARFYARALHGAWGVLVRRLLRRDPDASSVAAAIDFQVARSLTRHLPGLFVSRYRSVNADGVGRWTAVAGRGWPSA